MVKKLSNAYLLQLIALVFVLISLQRQIWAYSVTVVPLPPTPVAIPATITPNKKAPDVPLPDLIDPKADPEATVTATEHWTYTFAFSPTKAGLANAKAGSIPLEYSSYVLKQPGYWQFAIGLTITYSDGNPKHHYKATVCDPATFTVETYDLQLTADSTKAIGNTIRLGSIAGIRASAAAAKAISALASEFDNIVRQHDSNTSYTQAESEKLHQLYAKIESEADVIISTDLTLGKTLAPAKDKPITITVACNPSDVQLAASLSKKELFLSTGPSLGTLSVTSGTTPFSSSFSPGPAYGTATILADAGSLQKKVEITITGPYEEDVVYKAEWPRHDAVDTMIATEKFRVDTGMDILIGTMAVIAAAAAITAVGIEIAIWAAVTGLILMVLKDTIDHNIDAQTAAELAQHYQNVQAIDAAYPQKLNATSNTPKAKEHDWRYFIDPH